MLILQDTGDLQVCIFLHCSSLRNVRKVSSKALAVFIEIFAKFAVREIPYSKNATLWENEVVGASISKFLLSHHKVTPKAKDLINALVLPPRADIHELRLRRATFGLLVCSISPSAFEGLSRISYDRLTKEKSTIFAGAPPSPKTKPPKAPSSADLWRMNHGL